MSGLSKSAFVRRSRTCVFIAAAGLLIGLTSCEGDNALQTALKSFPPPPTPTVEQPADVQYYPSDEPLHPALDHFKRGQFGIAGRLFRARGR